MKILVFSDSHGRGKRIVDAIKDHGGTCDAVIFLGDGVGEIDYVKAQFPNLIFFSVRGNCDLFAPDHIRDDALIDIDGIRPVSLLVVQKRRSTE